MNTSPQRFLIETYSTLPIQLRRMILAIFTCALWRQRSATKLAKWRRKRSNLRHTGWTKHITTSLATSAAYREQHIQTLLHDILGATPHHPYIHKLRPIIQITLKKRATSTKKQPCSQLYDESLTCFTRIAGKDLAEIVITCGWCSTSTKRRVG